ncbi:thiolase-like protein [Penicillium robsamsonii]|uniref:thiolase-like protein n=1 Tax=Penicillium robsamsonii TaxID=1792511 RepID=UPI0025497EBD|nr:thiolase-like protein [Penicillium robsamsonii]KAJ5817125.1 thiolase-like protein [Penicillium robsamsonii]
MSSSNQTFVLGVGMTQFLSPRGTRNYPELGFEAGVKAMLDAQITYDDVETGIACYCHGDSCYGQRIFYQFGLTSIPIFNTNNACATGSTGLFLARTLIQRGAADCVLVVGFEQMRPGSIKSVWDDRPHPVAPLQSIMEKEFGKHSSPRNAQFFGNAGTEYMRRYGAQNEDFAEIARVSHEHSTRNPYAQFRTEYSLEGIMNSKHIHGPLTKLQCSPTSDGAAAAVLVSEKFLEARPHLKSQAILMAGQAMQTDPVSTYSGSAMDLVGFQMTQRAVKAALEEARLTPQDVKVCELHDCFSANEMILLDALGFSGTGKAHEMVRRGDITYGGKGPVINPSGGLISKGHPLGATGLAQCTELVWQLRGWANNRLVDGADVALQHNLGLGGAVIVTVYKRMDGGKAERISDEEVKRMSPLTGYNPAVEARYITPEQSDRVRSRVNRDDHVLANTAAPLTARI